MLLQLRDFIKKVRLVSIEQLTREFHIEKDALIPMLDLWISRGVIEQCQETSDCARRCAVSCREKPVYYQWV